MLTRVVSDPVWTGSDKVFLSSVIVFPYDEMTEIIHKLFFHVCKRRIRSGSRIIMSHIYNIF